MLCPVPELDLLLLWGFKYTYGFEMQFVTPDHLAGNLLFVNLMCWGLSLFTT